MSMTLSDLRALPHVSISQLKTFLQCPRKYRFQYVDRLEPAFRPIALAFGTAFHAAVGHHLLDPSAAREELHARLRDTLTAAVNADGIPVLFEDEEDMGAYLDLGVRMLDVFFDKVPRPERVLGVEVPFVLALTHPVTGETAPLPLIGSIDAVVVEQGEQAVWELKTGKKKWSVDPLEHDPQPTAYTMAARALGYGSDEVKLLVTTKTARPDVQVERLVRRRGDERELVETALGVLRAVQAGVDVRVRAWGCRSCAYAGACAA